MNKKEIFKVILQVFSFPPLPLSNIVVQLFGKID